MLRPSAFGLPGPFAFDPSNGGRTVRYQAMSSEQVVASSHLPSWKSSGSPQDGRPGEVRASGTLEGPPLQTQDAVRRRQGTKRRRQSHRSRLGRGLLLPSSLAGRVERDPERARARLRSPGAARGARTPPGRKDRRRNDRKVTAAVTRCGYRRREDSEGCLRCRGRSTNAQTSWGEPRLTRNTANPMIGCGAQ